MKHAKNYSNIVLNNILRQIKAFATQIDKSIDL